MRYERENVVPEFLDNNSIGGNPLKLRGSAIL